MKDTFTQWVLIIILLGTLWPEPTREAIEAFFQLLAWGIAALFGMI